MFTMKKIVSLFIIFLAIASVSFSQNQNPVYVIPVKGIIDLGLSSFIKRALSEAKGNNAQAVILEIDTFGGRVDAAVEITDSLEKVKPIPTIAFIDDQAWSAGALISLACEKIIMSEGSSIGSAEPRAIGGFGGKDELTDEKTVSALRAKFKAVAEQNRHPANLALAMVDKDIEVKLVKIKDEIKILTAQELEEIKSQYKEREIQVIKTINPKGKLLNLTAKEAKELGIAGEILNNRKEILEYLKLKEAKITELKPTWSEVMVRFITHPMLSPLLLSLGFLGIIFELKIPGWGLSGTLGVLCLALFFWGHYLAGLANWTEILMFATGIILLSLEIFVIPGFGIAGAGGICLIISGVFLALIKHPFHIPRIELTGALYTLGYAGLLTIIAVLAALKFLPKSPLWKNIILSASEKKEAGFRSAPDLDIYLGKSGKTITILRPSGRAVFEEKTLSVLSQGDFIDKDKPVRVVKIEGGELVVEEIHNV
ncbi:nodulation protein NfeD [bacterium]|nr:MAG: nodulation protein NfeD [bacterium]